jgi:hypothetical protein
LSIRNSSSASKKFLLTIWDDGKRYTKCNEIGEIFGGNEMHGRDEGSEACLNRQILNNPVKRKAMGDLCERPRKVIPRELQNQDLDNLT